MAHCDVQATGVMEAPSTLHGIESWLFIVLIGFVANYYADTIAMARIPMGQVVCASVGAGAVGLMAFELFFPSPAGASFTTFLAALVLAAGFWFHYEQDRDRFPVLSNIGTSPSPYEGGSLPSSSFSPFRAGFGPTSGSSSSLQSALVPLFNSLVVRLREDKDARHIFYFLSINLMFMFVEFLYGIWSNSLGLISDAAHMLFDCLALAIGLCALVIAEWKPNQSFTFGYAFLPLVGLQLLFSFLFDAHQRTLLLSNRYGRVNVLSAFINSIFLIFIAISVLVEAFARLYQPVEIHHDRLLLVSVLGLGVNLVGLFVFHNAHAAAHGHSHGGGGHSHGGSSKKAHDHSDHGHSHVHHGDHGDHDHHGHSHSAPALDLLEEGAAKGTHGHDEALSGTIRTAHEQASAIERLTAIDRCLPARTRRYAR